MTNPFCARKRALRVVAPQELASATLEAMGWVQAAREIGLIK